MFNIIVATDLQNNIGRDNKIPWYLPEDLKYFRDITTGNGKNAVIMGRKTWESIPEKYRPFKNRFNIVLTRDVGKHTCNNSSMESVMFMSSLQNALNYLYNRDDFEDIFVIGGSQIYKEALEHSDLNKIYITKINTIYENCDCVFPTYKNNPYLVKVSASKYLKFPDTSPSIIYQHLVYSVHPEYQYLNLVKDIIDNGAVRDDRTGTGVLSLFGKKMEFDLKHHFPLLTTKRVFWRAVVEELLFFIRGQTDANILSNLNITIWDGNTSREFLDQRGLEEYDVGDMGPMYGWNWRHWGAGYWGCKHNYKGQGIDQLIRAINEIKTNPTSRRILISAWNPSVLKAGVLPPCHVMFQFYVQNNYLSCQLYQRSGDMGLGIPFNIASYSLLTYMMAQVCGLKPGKFIHVIGDAHVYKTHIEPLKIQLQREPWKFPTLELNSEIKNIENFEKEDIKLMNYKSHPFIKMQMAV